MSIKLPWPLQYLFRQRRNGKVALVIIHVKKSLVSGGFLSQRVSSLESNFVSCHQQILLGGIDNRPKLFVICSVCPITNVDLHNSLFSKRNNSAILIDLAFFCYHFHNGQTETILNFTILWSVKIISFSGTRCSERSWISPPSQWKP